MCCSPWGPKESDMTEQPNNKTKKLERARKRILFHRASWRAAPGVCPSDTHCGLLTSRLYDDKRVISATRLVISYSRQSKQTCPLLVGLPNSHQSCRLPRGLSHSHGSAPQQRPEPLNLPTLAPRHLSTQPQLRRNPSPGSTST